MLTVFRFIGALARAAVRVAGSCDPETNLTFCGKVRAIDPKTGEKKWDFKMVDFTDSGILTTASDALFVGGKDGDLFPLDARDGKMLWGVNLGGTIAEGP